MYTIMDIIKKKTCNHTMFIGYINSNIYNVWETILQVDYIHVEKYSRINNPPCMYM